MAAYAYAFVCALSYTREQARDAGDVCAFIIKLLSRGQGALATVHANSRVVESFG